MLTIGSVFSGIGGLELGLERAGVGRTVWQCECDPYALRVLARHWPHARRFTDVRALDASTPPVDVVCGGFPCQDVSNAGKRAGLSGERSGLFYELMRAVRLLRPRFLVLENVAALLARGLGPVLSELAACGFDAEWDCVPASAVGAPHQRDRVFVLGFSRVADARRAERRARAAAGDDAHGADAGRAEEAGRAGERGPVRGGGRAGGGAGADAVPDAVRGGRRGRGDEPESKRRRGDAADVGADGATADADFVGRDGRSRTCRVDAGWRQPPLGGRWEPEPDVGRMAHGVPARVDRLRTLGNAVVPPVAEVVGRALLAYAHEKGLLFTEEAAALRGEGAA